MANVIRRMPFEVLFERGRLLQALEDLLNTAADYASGPRMASAPSRSSRTNGLVRRVRPRGSR
jgi:hypothetical protein